MLSANYPRHFDRSEAEGEISPCLYGFDLRKLRSLFQRALNQRQAAFCLLAQQFFAIVALALHAVKFIRNRQRRQHRNFLRVHGFRRVGDRLHFFVNVLRKPLHVLRIQLSLDGVHLPENLDFYRPAHGVSARPYRHNTTFAPGINPARPRAPLVRAKSHLHFSRPSVLCEIQPVGFPSPRNANSSAHTRSASWPPRVVLGNPPLRCNTLSGSCHSICRRRNESQRLPCRSLPTAVGRCSLPSKSSPFFGARNGNKQSRARLPRT